MKRDPTIKPRTYKQGPIQLSPQRTHPKFWQNTGSNTFLYIVLTILFLAGVGVGLYFLITHFKENFGCKLCQEDPKIDKNN